MTSASALTGSSSDRSCSMASASCSPALRRVAALGALVAADQRARSRPRGTATRTRAGRPAGRRWPGGCPGAGRSSPRASATRSMLDSGTMASSATFGMSGVGRLSITNQPRSSSASATVDRPAPESPAMTTNSVIRPQRYPWSACTMHAGDPVLGRLGYRCGRGRRKGGITMGMRRIGLGRSPASLVIAVAAVRASRSRRARRCTPTSRATTMSFTELRRRHGQFVHGLR